MRHFWIYKPDGTTQCSPTGQGEISLDVMQQELANLIGAENIIGAEKRRSPKAIIALCGAPTGQVNAYKITLKGFGLLQTGISGPCGFEVWVQEPFSGAATFADRPPVPWPSPLEDWGDDVPVPWPIAAIASSGSTLDEATRAMINVIGSLTQVGQNPTTLAELIGRRCRFYTEGDALTLDHVPSRVNVEITKAGAIQKIWFG